jgi:hypothetical protein
MPKRKTKRKRKIKKKRKYKGGAVSMDFTQPNVVFSNTDSAVLGTINTQATKNNNLVRMNQKMSGGSKISVPRLHQAGADGNALIGDAISLELTARADSEFDNKATIKLPTQGMVGAGKKRRKKRTKTKKTRKSKKYNRKRRRKTKKRRKY